MKKLTNKSVCILCICVCIATSLHSQNTFYLNNGSIVKGRLLEFLQDSIIKIETPDKSIVVSDVKEIKKIISDNNMATLQIERPMETRYYADACIMSENDRGLYSAISGNINVEIIIDKKRYFGVVKSQSELMNRMAKNGWSLQSQYDEESSKLIGLTSYKAIKKHFVFFKDMTINDNPFPKGDFF